MQSWYDQRGMERGSSAAGTGSASDIGAYEAAILDVTANSQQITYGDTLPAQSYTLASGPSGYLTGNVALNTAETNAGTYNGDIGIGSLALLSNEYLLNFTAGKDKALDLLELYASYRKSGISESEFGQKKRLFEKQLRECQRFEVQPFANVTLGKGNIIIP